MDCRDRFYFLNVDWNIYLYWFGHYILILGCRKTLWIVKTNYGLNTPCRTVYNWISIPPPACKDHLPVSDCSAPHTCDVSLALVIKLPPENPSPLEVRIPCQHHLHTPVTPSSSASRKAVQEPHARALLNCSMLLQETYSHPSSPLTAIAKHALSNARSSLRWSSISFNEPCLSSIQNATMFQVRFSTSQRPI